MPFQAITVTFQGPTNRLGSRVTARCQAKKITRGREYGLNDYANAQKIVSELCGILDWQGVYHCGIQHNGAYVFVWEGKDNATTIAK